MNVDIFRTGFYRKSGNKLGKALVFFVDFPIDQHSMQDLKMITSQKCCFYSCYSLVYQILNVGHVMVYLGLLEQEPSGNLFKINSFFFPRKV